MSGRAILFDLDDTLHRERRFALSGFMAVAMAVERCGAASRQECFARLVRSLRCGRRSTAFQDLAEQFGLPSDAVAEWIEVYRAHAPRLRLCRHAACVLDALRSSWRVGIVTNGLPSVQAAKVESLGLRDRVDLVVLADRFGGGKPAREPFLEALRALGVTADRTVFVGNDPALDVAGASQVGIRTVLIAGRRSERGAAVHPALPGPRADAVVDSLTAIPAVAERLVPKEAVDVS